MDLFRSNLLGRPLWATEYSFAAAYSPQASASAVIDAAAVAAMLRQLQADPTLYSQWSARRFGMFFGALPDSDRYAVLCASSAVTNTDFERCLQQGGFWPTP
jgi:hypothetical protein